MPDENINIYIPYTTETFRATGSYNNTKMIIRRGDLANGIMAHEMGHVLYLFHTFKGHRDLEDPLDQDNNYTDCEHVTRVENDEDYNAKTKGDYIIDTAAAPDFLFEHYYELLEQGNDPSNYEPFKYIENCIYIGTGQNCIDELYEIYPSDTTNPMAYLPNDCRDKFTIGQAIRMHEIIELWPQNYSSVLTGLEDLFEPYTGEYYVVGPVPDHSPLFQPGFEYRFIECEGDYPAPAAYGTVFPYTINTVLLTVNNDESNYQAITHPNHSAILIKHEYGDFLNKPEKCYNNFNRKPSLGLITKFNDNVFNTNVTIMPQDSTSINNENLIEELDSGLYKIDKIYEDGATQETVIFKENN